MRAMVADHRSWRWLPPVSSSSSANQLRTRPNRRVANRSRQTHSELAASPRPGASLKRQPWRAANWATTREAAGTAISSSRATNKCCMKLKQPNLLQQAAPSPTYTPTICTVSTPVTAGNCTHSHTSSSPAMQKATAAMPSMRNSCTGQGSNDSTTCAVWNTLGALP